MSEDTVEIKKEELEELIEKKVEERVEERVREEIEDEPQKNDVDEGISRRGFLKKLGAGALGFGAISLPSVSALDIRSDGLSYYGGQNSNLDFDIDNSGNVNLLGSLSLGGNLKAKDGELIWDEAKSQIPSSVVDLSGINHDNLSGVSADDHHPDPRYGIRNLELQNTEMDDSWVSGQSGGQIGWDASVGFFVHYGSSGGGVGKGYGTLLDTSNLQLGSNLYFSGGESEDVRPSLAIDQGSGSGLDADTIDGKHASELGGEFRFGHGLRARGSFSGNTNAPSDSVQTLTQPHRSFSGAVNAKIELEANGSQSGTASADAGIEATLQTSGGATILAGNTTATGNEFSSTFKQTQTNINLTPNDEITARVHVTNVADVYASKDAQATASANGTASLWVE
ncbi:MAG: twin-arginine translocation signal domain-containing protein [Nanohaloarchaea archaeon]|nr:twin-arginine translocation signal domain-containing protein [Candidatus Nanohaloarchaea archaeon]